MAGRTLTRLAGRLLLGVVPATILIPLLALLLVLSSAKVWGHSH